MNQKNHVQKTSAAIILCRCRCRLPLPPSRIHFPAQIEEDIYCKLDVALERLLNTAIPHSHTHGQGFPYRTQLFLHPRSAFS
jgi:hypothetical protein